MPNRQYLRKLAIITVALLTLNFLMAYLIHITPPHEPESDGEMRGMSLWRLVFLVIIPLCSLIIAAIAAFSMKQTASYFHKLLQAFLTTLIAIYLLGGAPVFIIIVYALIRGALV